MRPRFFIPALAAIVALGLALRIWSAQGGLWLDEAWSAVLAERARTPWGILVAINHDNNHHLNSLWMQACGLGASPLRLRALSIATGTLAILVAAAIGARQSAGHALVAALLFAVSPILVNYGSEARGYAPMLLAALAMIWVVQRVLGVSADAPQRWAWVLAGLALIGLFSNLTMLFVVAAIAGWIVWATTRRMPLDAALASSARLLLPTLGACGLATGAIVGVAVASPTGIQVGDYVPFSLADWGRALSAMAATTLGLNDSGPWIAAALVASIGALVWRAGVPRSPARPFQWIAILGFPLFFPLLQIGNSGIARYYLLVAIAILLLVSDTIAAALTERRTRGVATLALLVLTAACIWEDGVQAGLRRGDPGAAIEAMRRLSPVGATVMVDHPGPVATLRVAAASATYPLAIVTGCPSARFLQVDLDFNAAAPATTARCGHRYRLILVRRASRLSGVDWALYERAEPPPLRQPRDHRG